MKPVSARLPVRAISRSSPMRSSISAHSAPVRWSFQRIAGRSTRSAASRATRPCICPESPIPAISSRPERRERGLGGTPPVLRVLLRPAGTRRRERIAPLGHCDHVAVRRDGDRLHARRADVEPDEHFARLTCHAGRPVRGGALALDAPTTRSGATRSAASTTKPPDAIVLIDPLVPSEQPEAARFWEALDRDVRRADVPVHVLITVFWHARSAGEIVRRYDGRLHAASRARAAIQRRTNAVTDVFRPGEPLPGRRRGAGERPRHRGRLLDPGAPDARPGRRHPRQRRRRSAPVPGVVAPGRSRPRGGCARRCSLCSSCRSSGCSSRTASR